jgi:hypothetical protein
MTIVLLYLTLQEPTTQLLVITGACVVFAPIFAFLAVREIRKLRYEYRYEDDDDGSAAQD